MVGRRRAARSYVEAELSRASSRSSAAASMTSRSPSVDRRRPRERRAPAQRQGVRHAARARRGPAGAGRDRRRASRATARRSRSLVTSGQPPQRLAAVAARYTAGGVRPAGVGDDRGDEPARLPGAPAAQRLPGLGHARNRRRRSDARPRVSGTAGSGAEGTERKCRAWPQEMRDGHGELNFACKARGQADILRRCADSDPTPSDSTSGSGPRGSTRPARSRPRPLRAAKSR